MKNKLMTSCSALLSAGLWLSGASALLACSSTDDGDAPLPTPTPGAVPSVTEQNSQPDEPSLYALLYLVWSDDGPTGYVALSDTLDRTNVSLNDSREVPGYASMAAVGGDLLVASGDEPSITRYTIGPDLSWQSGPTLSFANQGVEAAGFFRQFIADDDTAYAELEVNKRVVWDPSTLEIRGVKETSMLDLERNGLALFANYNRSYHRFQGSVMRPFSYHDEDWYEWAADTQLVVYDASTQDEAKVLSAPCPGLDTVTTDEAGNSYFSTWEYPALHGLAGRAAPCVTKVNADGTLGSLPDLTQWTEGRQLKLFNYLADGKAVAAVLHHEDYGDVDFPALDIDGFYEIEGLHYRLWLFDLEQQSARPLEGIAEGYNVNSTYSIARLDGKSFVFLSAEDSSNTKVYELDSNGTATERFEVPGVVYQWLKVR
ncbi:MAG: hypothetical protein RL685_535 [Pseudomonadota bacterium]|jgi:hypothetical protein